MILFVNLGLCVFISTLTVPTSQSNALLHFVHLKLMIVFSMLLFLVFPSLFDFLRPTAAYHACLLNSPNGGLSSMLAKQSNRRFITHA